MSYVSTSTCASMEIYKNTYHSEQSRYLLNYCTTKNIGRMQLIIYQAFQTVKDRSTIASHMFCCASALIKLLINFRHLFDKMKCIALVPRCHKILYINKSSGLIFWYHKANMESDNILKHFIKKYDTLLVLLVNG